MFEAFPQTFQQWKDLSRDFLQRRVRPEAIQWKIDLNQLDLFGLEESLDFSPVAVEGQVESSLPRKGSNTSLSEQAQEKGDAETKSSIAHRLPPLTEVRVSREFLKSAETIGLIRSGHAWDILYRVLFRMQFGERNLLRNSADPDVREFYLLEKSVRRDIHKMHAFVRFKEVIEGDTHKYVAWYAPDFDIIEAVAPFFRNRFGDRPFSIYSPFKSLHWDLNKLSFSKGIDRHEFQHQDHFDQVWKSYYQSIYNPARLNLSAMLKEMPKKFWSEMPEAHIIQELVRKSPHLLQEMQGRQYKLAEVPPTHDLDELKLALQNCTSCDLYEKSTQAVFGAGDRQAQIMVIGEQPGDEEDKQGTPFVGPSGQLLKKVLNEIEVNLDSLYFTNVVKHFAWSEGESGRRLHKTASARQQSICRPWLEAEIQAVKPRLIIGLGRTASLFLLGKKVNMEEMRGQVFEGLPWAEKVLITWHPSALLRAPSQDEKAKMLKSFKQDLKRVLAQCSAVVSPDRS